MSYRARPGDGSAWVTGASSGIGRGVALELAKRGYVVYTSARRVEELQSLAREAAGLTGRIEVAQLDVTDRDACLKTFELIESKGPIALAFLNAGSWFDDPPGDYCGVGFRKTFDLNVLGVANCLNPAMRAMRGRRKGQIAITASIAGFGGLPNNGPYGPSKAAVISIAVGAKFLADQSDVTVQVVNPGYVRTPLTDGRREDPKMFMIESADAAQRICNGFEREGFEITFPRRLSWFLKFMNHMPYPVYFGMFAWFLPKAKE